MDAPVDRVTVARQSLARGDSHRAAAAASGLTYYQIRRLAHGRSPTKAAAPQREKPPYPPLPGTAAAATTPRVNCPRHGPVFAPCFACWLSTPRPA